MAYFQVNTLVFVFVIECITSLLNCCTWGVLTIFFVSEDGVVEKTINILQGLGRMLYLSMRLKHSPFLIRNL